MRLKTLAFAIACSAAALAAPASASLSGFRLPGEQPQQTPPPDLQGPVAPDVPESRRVPTPTPTARTTAPAPTPTPTSVEFPTNLQPVPTASPAHRTPAPAPTSAVPTSPAAALPEPAALPPVDTVASGPAPQATAAPVSVGQESDGGWSPWWLAAVPLLLAVLALAAWAVRRGSRGPIGQVAAPQIERPRVGPAAAAPQPPAPAPAEPLQVSLEPLRLSLTLMNATLAYRLELANRGTTPLTGLAVGADMIAAHASMSREEQLAGPRADAGAATQRIDRLEPGETRVIEGEFRLPFPQIVPIRQGNAALLLPLARFRVEADGAQPLVRTFVIGQPGQGSSLQPFRLDQGPRVYPRLAQHAFA